MEIKKIASMFQIEGEIKNITPYGDGHINVTYLLETDKKRYILQKMNTYVFKDPVSLMKNIEYVTEYLLNKGIETLEIVRTKDNKTFLEGEECYRVYKFIENTVSYSLVTSKEVFENSGRAFGEFQNELANFDASKLSETIYKFHDTKKRFNDFLNALNNNKAGRIKNCQKEIDYILEHVDTYSVIVDALENKEIPLRVTHNDTKLNNILMDEKTLKSRAIIDLDTIMPGSMMYDFGDSIRFGANHSLEDEKDLSKVNFDIELFESYAKGYLKAVKNSITEREKELIAYGAYMMTIECGMRFLTDYLDGDIYFHTSYEEQNLYRTRTQIKLADDMLKNMDKMNEIVFNILK